MSSWGTALRIARREARRSKGRSALVIAMIGLPALALAFAAATIDMFNLRPEESLSRELGTADAKISWVADAPIMQTVDGTGYSSPSQAQPRHTDVDLLALLPPGSAVAVGPAEGNVSMRTAAGVGDLNAAALDLTDPITYGMGEVLEGRAPTAAGEIALTPRAATRLGVGVGDTAQMAGENDTRYRVVGLVELGGRIDETVLFPAGGLPGSTSTDPAAGQGAVWLVKTPAPVTWDMVRQLNQKGLLVVSREVVLNPPPEAENEFGGSRGNGLDPAELAIGVLVAGLALLEVVLLAGPAFAVGARRRQRQLALVVANGGTPTHVRRIVLADGVVLGVLGAAAGVAVGVGLALAARPLIEEYLAHSRAGGYRVYPIALIVIAGLAVVTGVAAAMVPAFVAARQNVVAALSGRRGIVRSRKRWLVLGLAMVALGAVVVLYGTWQVSANVMLAGLIVGELGLVFATPALVGLVARLGRTLPLALRIAVRDTARNRAAAAPAISAVMAAVAGSVAMAVYLGADSAQRTASYQAGLPTGYVSVGLESQAGPDQTSVRATPEQVTPILRQHLPVEEIAEVRTVACPAVPGTVEAGPPPSAGKVPVGYCFVEPVVPPQNMCPYLDLQREPTAAEQRAARRDERCDMGGGWMMASAFMSTVVDDGSAIRAITGASPEDIEAATATLRAGGVVVSNHLLVVDGRATVRSFKADSDSRTEEDFTVPAYVLRSGTLTGSILSPQVVERAGLTSRLTNLAVATTRMPTQAETDALYAALTTVGAWAVVERGPLPGDDPTPLILAAVAALITLGAAGIATGLAAADGRADLSTLAAVGASPRVRRALSLSQSGVISGLGSLLGAAAGLGAAVAVLSALNQRYADIWPAPIPYPITVPWLSLGLALLVVPAVAMAGAGLLTRSRLPIERRAA